MSKKKNNVPDPTLAASDPKRTPVSAGLAEKIQAIDEALMAEFGFDLCYVIMSRDGIVSASNARDGYLPPIVATVPPANGN